MNDNIKLEIIEGKNKNDATKTWRALKIEIGEWSKLVFVNSDRPLINSNFELDYIEKTLEEAK